MTSPKERAPYSAIVDRPKFALPDGARIVVWTIINLEVWDISRPMPRQALPAPGGNVLLPDLPNWCWHEYGMRVGFWRFHELFERFACRPTLSVNARVCLDYPKVSQAGKDAGWEFMAHGFEQVPLHMEKDQAGMIARTLNTIEQFAGRRPVGWLGPGLTETNETPEYLAAAGIKYVADWVYDDEPTKISTAHGPLVTLPFTIECNDLLETVIQHHDGAHWTQKCIDTFDCLYREGAVRPKFMAIVIHPYITGQPFLIKYHEAVCDYIAKFPGVLHWNGQQILDWYLKVSG